MHVQAGILVQQRPPLQPFSSAARRAASTRQHVIAARRAPHATAECAVAATTPRAYEANARRLRERIGAAIDEVAYEPEESRSAEI